MNDGLSTEVPGARVQNKALTIVPEDSVVRPLRDMVVLEPLDWEPSKYIKVVYSGETLRGRVIAIGPGRYRPKYDGPKGKRTKKWLGNVFIPTEFQIGDIVELGGLEIRGYLHKSFMWGSKECLLVQEDDCGFSTHD